MNTQQTAFTSRIARAAAALSASLLVTFTGLQLIADYALPSPAQAASVQMAAAAVSMPAPVR